MTGLKPGLQAKDVRAMLNESNHLRQRAEGIRRSAIDRCLHDAYSFDGGHVYCDGCDQHIGDPCRNCSHLKRSSRENCAKCGAL